MSSKHTTYYFFTTALLLVCSLAITSCENDQAEVDALYKKKIAVEEAFNIESFLSQTGKVKAKLTAPFMLRYQTDSAYMEFPRTMHVDFYDDSTIIESTVDAKYAKYIEYDRKVFLRDSVVVINKKNGDTLRTPELWWDQDKQEIYTNKPSHILQRDKIIFAEEGLRAKQNFSAYSLFKSSGPMLVPNNGLPQ